MPRNYKKRRPASLNELDPETERIFVNGPDFDGDMVRLRPTWDRYKDQLLKKYQKPGYRIYAWWYYNFGVSPDFLSWMDNVPMAERRRYRTVDGKVIPNRLHTIL